MNKMIFASEVSLKGNPSMWNLGKNGINGLICKPEIETQRQRTNVQIPRGKGVRMNWG